MADGKVVIDVILDDGTVAKGVADIDNKLGGLGNTGQKASLGIGKIASALGLVYIAKKGIDLVRDSLDGAIDRYDTLNQFPRVMQMIGFDAEESEGAINKLSEGIDGLPTTLDSVASTAQNIAVMTGDLDGAVDTTLALNNAFLASGASSADAERGLQQYVQMLSKGEVDLQSWRTLQETMGVALRTVADEFGFTGKAATNDLYDALKSGEITMDEFNSKLIEASNAQGGFADMAAEASGGIKTSWTNMKTAVVKGLADVIGAIDEALGGTGEIEQIIDRMKAAFQATFSWIVSSIPVVAETIKSIADAAVDVYNSIKPWLPLIAAIAAGVGTFLLMANAFTIMSSIVSGAVGVFGAVKTAILAVRVAMITLNAAILANPIALVVAAIVAAAILIYVYWEPISEFFINLWNSIKDVGLEIWENLKEGWANAVQVLKETWQSIVEFFSGLMDSIIEIFTMWKERVVENWNTIFEAVKNVISGAYEWINDKTNGMFGVYVEIIKSYLMTAWEIIKSIWSYIQDTFSNFMDFIKALVKGDFEGMKDAMKSQMENAKNLLKNIWQAIKSNIDAKIKEILSNVIAKFIEIKNNIQNKITEAKNALVQKFAEMVTNTARKVAEIVSTVRGKFDDVKNAAKEKMEQAKTNVQDAWNKAIDFLKSIDLKQIGRDAIQGFINGIKDKVKAVGDAAKSAADAVTGKIKSILKIASPSKLLFQFGEWTGEGFSKGIAGMKKQVEKASDVLADSAIPDIPKFSKLDRLKGLTAESVISGVVSVTETNSQPNSILKKDEKEQTVIVIKPSNVDIDGRTVGEITWEFVDEHITRNQGILEKFRG